MRQEHAVTIARAPEEVFDFVDPAGNRRFRPPRALPRSDNPATMTKRAEGMVSFRVLEEKPGKVGTRHVRVIREGRAENEDAREMPAWARGRHRRAGAAREGWTRVDDMRFEPTPAGGTRMTHAVEYEMKARRS